MPQDLHHQLEQVIIGTEPGGRLPSEPKLAKKLGVSRATLREAMRTFETQGRLIRRQGIGTFVVHPSRVIESGLEVLESIEALSERIGLQVWLGDLEIQNHIANGGTSKKLHLEPGSKILRVSRSIYAEDRPIAYLVDNLPETILSNEDVNGGFTGSVLDLLLRRGDPVLGSSKCEIAAVAIEQEVARALNIQRGDALLCFKAILFAVDGSPVDYSLSYFLPGYFKFHVVRRIG
jgi:GntR family transcriptional regulator